MQIVLKNASVTCKSSAALYVKHGRSPQRTEKREAEATRGRDEKQRIKNGESENRRTRIKKINDNERPL